MRKLSILLVLILIFFYVLAAFPQKAQATFWCQKPVERAIKGTSNMAFGGTTPIRASMFIAKQNTHKICAVDLHINATAGSCSGLFTVKIYDNNSSYPGGGDGPGTLLATSNSVNCNTFVGDSGTFFNNRDGNRGNTNRWSFVSGSADGSSNFVDTTTMPLLVTDNKYWIVVDGSACVSGCTGVGWSYSTLQRQDATTGKNRSGTNVASLAAGSSPNLYGQFKLYADFPTGIYFDSTYNCDALGSETAPYTTTSEPQCDDSDITAYGASSDQCSATDDGHGNGDPAAPGYRPSSNDGPFELITTQANYPGGGGGKGQRHYLGIIVAAGDDANASGGLELYFQYPGASEIWMRGYIRYQAGWKWGGLGQSKTFYPTFFLKRPEGAIWSLSPYSATNCQSNGGYCAAGGIFGSAIDGPDAQCQHNCQHGNTSGPCTDDPIGCVGQTSCVTLLCQNGKGLGIGLYAAEGDHRWHGCATGGLPECWWRDIYPTGTSDGSWHALEVHQKMNTHRCPASIPGGAACDGVMQIWVDGVLKATVTDIDYGYPWKQGNGLTPVICTQNCNPAAPGYIDATHTGESPALMGMEEQKIGANGSLWDQFNTPGCHYMDYDDFKFSTDGYVGPITNNIPLAAGRPTNVHVE